MDAPVPSPSRLAKREADIAGEVRHAAARARLKAARPFQLPVSSERLSVLLVAGDELAAGLAPFCRVQRPETPDALDAMPDGERFDLVLVELTLDLGRQRAWRALLGRAHDPRRGQRLARLGASAPTALVWLTEPWAVRAAFADEGLALGPLFAADPAAGADALPLPAAFDPHRHNPLKPMRAGRLVDDVGVLAVDPLRTVMYGADDGVLAADLVRLAPFGLALADERWKLRPDPAHVPAPLLDRYLGRIDADERQALQALARFAVVPGRGVPAARARLEALGAATLPILTGGDGGSDPFALSVDDAVERVLPRYAGLFWALERRTHQGYRDAHRRHGYRARLRDGLARLPSSDAAELAARLAPEGERASVDMIVPTMRPWQLPYVHAMFAAQTHGPRTLSLMIHGEPFDLSAHFPAIAADDRVRWRFVPRDYAIGTLLNMAVAESGSDYWAKIDDDDFYGPDYLGDYLLLADYAGFAIAGKNNLFDYDEAEDAIFSRKDVTHGFSRKDILAGGSFFCRRSADILPFDERVCGYADTDFLWRNEEAGRAILASDRYNFCQIRRRDRASHTWRVGPDELPMRERVANGRRFAAVCA